MALESLFDDAFVRGCGISRSHALRTPRYKELLASVPHVTHTKPHEVAEMMYLGERLSDRAFQNLPYSIRQRALKWQQMSYLDQHQLLNTLRARLTTSRWLVSSSGRSFDSYGRLSSALPAECGSWSRGRVQPNCLGLAQMLVGFARATGADHMMVDVTMQRDYYVEQRLYIMLLMMIEKLKPHDSDPGIARVLRKLDTIRLRSLRMLVLCEKTRQAHHALAIRVGDDWVLLDPYLGTKYHLDGLGLSASRQLSGHPRSRWMMTGADQLEADQSMLLLALDQTLEAFGRRDLPASQFNGMVALEPVIRSLALVGVDVNTERASRDRTADVMRRMFYYALLTASQRKQYDGTVSRKTLDIDALAGAIVRNKRARNAMLKRLVYSVCMECLDAHYDAVVTKKGEHRGIELAHPTYNLAVATLNHLGGKTERSTAELVRFSSSQWIIHDTLGEVVTSENVKLLKIIDTHLRKIEKYPHMVMPELLAHLRQER